MNKSFPVIKYFILRSTYLILLLAFFQSAAWAQVPLQHRGRLNTALNLGRKAEKKAKDPTLRAELKTAMQNLQKALDSKKPEDEAQLQRAILAAYSLLGRMAQSATMESPKFHAFARETVDQLKPVVWEMEKSGFEEAKKKGSAAAYEKFMEDFPDSDVALASEALARARQLQFFDALSEDTPSAYAEFLRRYPQSRYAPVARMASMSVQTPEAEKAAMVNQVKTIYLLLDKRNVSVYMNTPIGVTENVEFVEIESMLRDLLVKEGFTVVMEEMPSAELLLYVDYTEVHGTIRTGSGRMAGGYVDRFAFTTGVRFKYMLLSPRIGVVYRGLYEVKPESLAEEGGVTLARFRDSYLWIFGKEIKAALQLR